MFDEEGFVPAPNNPGWILCWAIFSVDPWHLVSVHKFEDDARSKLENYSDSYQVSHGSWRVGTDEFVGNEPIT